MNITIPEGSQITIKGSKVTPYETHQNNRPDLTYTAYGEKGIEIDGVLLKEVEAEMNEDGLLILTIGEISLVERGE